MSSDLDAVKDIPGYKNILKTVLKSQIQLLIEQLAASTDEESVILTASISDGTLSHLGSESGNVFLENHEDVKSQFLRFCLNRQTLQGNSEILRNCESQDLTSNLQKHLYTSNYSRSKFVTNGCDQKTANARVHPVYLAKAFKTPVTRNPGLRHAPYPVCPPQRLQTRHAGTSFDADSQENEFPLVATSTNNVTAMQPGVKIEPLNKHYAECTFSQNTTSITNIENKANDLDFSDFGVDKLADSSTDTVEPSVEIAENYEVDMNIAVKLESVTVGDTDIAHEEYDGIEESENSNVSMKLGFGSKLSSGIQEKNSEGFSDTLDVWKTEEPSQYFKMTEIPFVTQEGDSATDNHCLKTQSFRSHDGSSNDFKHNVEREQSDQVTDTVTLNIKSKTLENDFIEEAGSYSHGTIVSLKSGVCHGSNMPCDENSMLGLNDNSKSFQEEIMSSNDILISHIEASESSTGETESAIKKQISSDETCSKGLRYSCDICSRKFRFKCLLKAHTRTCSRPNADPRNKTCLQGFEDVDVLKEQETFDEIRAHKYIQQIQDSGLSDEERHWFGKFIGKVTISSNGFQLMTCKQCNKDFLRGRFFDHVFAHLKPYKCLKCGFGFRQRADRRNHLIKSHKLPVVKHANFVNDSEALHYKAIFSHILSVLCRRLNKSDKQITIDFNHSPKQNTVSKKNPDNIDLLADSAIVKHKVSDINTDAQQVTSEKTVDSVEESPFLISAIKALASIESVTEQTSDCSVANRSDLIDKQRVEQLAVKEKALQIKADSPAYVGHAKSPDTYEHRNIIDSYICQIVYKEDGFQYVICKLCSKEFLGKRFLEHIFNHTKPYKCWTCGDGFRCKCDRRNHYVTAHNCFPEAHLTDAPDEEAEHFKDIFSNVLSKKGPVKRKVGIIDTHEKVVRRGSHAPVSVDILSPKITEISNSGRSMNKSRTIHKNSKLKEQKQKYVSCKTCGLLIRSSHMKDHSYVHSKPFRCKLCPYASARKSVLDLHMAVRHGLQEAS